MQLTTPPPSNPFHPITGDLLPEYRDAYLQRQLSPALADTVETYLRRSPVQANIVLGRFHALAELARQRGQPALVPPAWVQQELLLQPTVSGVGPLRRPLVQVALALFLLLGIASIVQWIRNEPLVPAPVVAAVVQATQATQRLVERFSRPAVAKDAPPRPPQDAAAAEQKPQVAHAEPKRPLPTATLPVRPASVASVVAADTLAGKAVMLPAALPATLPTRGSTAGTLRGRITDAQGRPLAGATVLVKGSNVATSTNAAGDYMLPVPAGATLLFGYGGYEDQVLRSPGPGSLNVVLQRSASASTGKLFPARN